MTQQEKIWAIVAAAGIGRRMMSAAPKQYMQLAGRRVIDHALAALCRSDSVDGVVVGIRKGDKWWRAEPFVHDKLRAVSEGGISRARTVHNALQQLQGIAAADDWVMVHDAARPCVRQQDIEKLIAAARANGVGAVLACKLADTMKQADREQVIDKTVAAAVAGHAYWRAVTPQVFRYEALRVALAESLALADRQPPTDESAAMERTGARPVMVAGHPGNIKITVPADLELAARYLSHDKPPQLRIGHGYDAHRLESGRRLILGGVDIEWHLGLAGHSDGDVLLHALCDACLGAAGRGDMGRHFPSADEKYRDADSRMLVREVGRMLNADNMRVGNLDCTIVAERPPLSPHIPQMTQHIAADLNITAAQVHIKATTTDGLGFCGREQGIAAHAVVLVESAQ